MTRLQAAIVEVLAVAEDTSNPTTKSISLWIRWVRACVEYRVALAEAKGVGPDDIPTLPDLSVIIK
jgi:hypothetical protein